MFYEMNIIMMYHHFSPNSTKGPYKNQLNASWFPEKTLNLKFTLFTKNSERLNVCISRKST